MEAALITKSRLMDTDQCFTREDTAFGRRRPKGHDFAASSSKINSEASAPKFFHWEEKKEVCVDFPEVDITVALNGQHKRVIEGCNASGKVLKVAAEIDRISGAESWVGKAR